MQYYTPFPLNMSLQRWKRNMFFTGVRNTTLSKRTAGGFPVTDAHCQYKTHPVFVLRITSCGPVVCPGSRKNWYNKEDRRYILAGTKTSTNDIIRDTTYLAEEHSFCIPRGMSYAEDFKNEFTNMKNNNCPPLYCMGIVKDQDIKG